MGGRATQVLVLAILLGACGQPEAMPSAALTPVLPHADAPAADLTALAALAADAVLVQYDQREVMGWSASRNEAWGHVPPVTLLADGLLIYQDDTLGLVRVQLDATETASLLAGVRAAGWEQVVAHAEACTRPGGCFLGFDGGIQIVRVRDAAGALREVMDNRLVDDPIRMQFYAIAHGLYGYRDARAIPFESTHATLIVEPDHSGQQRDAVVWPLDRQWLVPLDNPEVREVVGVLAGEDLRTMTTAVNLVTRRWSFVADGQSYRAEVVPWLPGSDYAAEVARVAGCTFYAAPMAVTPTVYQTAMPTPGPPTATPTISPVPDRPPPATPTFLPEPYPAPTYPPPTPRPAGCPP